MAPSKKNEQDWLDLVPVVKNDIETIIHDDGLASITIPRFKKRWMVKLFLAKNKTNEIRVDFDVNGTAVWLQIDGKQSVRDILETLKEIAQTEKDYNNRVLLFLRNIYRNKFISVK
jgi:hypothetical protein